MKTLIATCSASYANTPLVSPVCPSNDNYVPIPMYLQREHEGESATTVQSEATREPEDEPCFKHFKHFSTVVSEKLKEHITSRLSTPDNSPQHQVTEKYLNEMIPLREDADVLDFWVQHERIYPDVSDVAFDILTIPASSAPIEECSQLLVMYQQARGTELVGKTLRERC